MAEDICWDACPLTPCSLTDVMGEICWLYLCSQASEEMEFIWTSLENKFCCETSEDVFSREHLKGGWVLMNKLHRDGHSGWNQKNMALGVQPNSSSAIYHVPRGDSSSSGKQNSDCCLIRQHVEGWAAHYSTNRRCHQMLVSAYILPAFLGLFISSKGSNYQEFNESRFADVNI